MGDFLRGVKVKSLPAAIALGVHNHLAVDRFTDSHPGLRQLKTNFSSERRRFAGIILDVVFDHFLIKHWRDHTREDLAAFTAYCYQSLDQLRQVMPTVMRQRVGWMIQYDLLNSYTELQGVANALNGISRRMRFDNCLAGAVEEIKAHYPVLEENFHTFFAELCAHVRDIKIEEAPNVERLRENDELNHRSVVHCLPPGRLYR